MSFIVTNMDCVDALKTLPDSSVQLCVMSPPYDNLRTYKGHSWNFEALAAQLFRVLCKGGVLCWNVADSVVKGSETLTSFRQAIHFKDVVGFNVHDTMHWNKNNFAHPSKNRYHQVHEYVFILSKGKPRCFNPIMDKKNATAGMVGTIGKNTYQKRDGSRDTRARYVTKEMGMRGNVWKLNTAGQENMGKSPKHPAQMPSKLARDLIISWSNPGDLVIDPMCGSGTTGIEALKLKRNAWLNDASAEYVALARTALEQTVIPML